VRGGTGRAMAGLAGSWPGLKPVTRGSVMAGL
jgi:hypothetical protein